MELAQPETPQLDGWLALEHLERFCGQVSSGLDAMDFGERHQLLLLLVERITVEDGRACIETVILTGPNSICVHAILTTWTQLLLSDSPWRLRSPGQGELD